MRSTLLALLVAFAVTSAAAAQNPPADSSRQVKDANNHYRRGWEAIQSEHWDEAVKEFDQTIDVEPEFELAYYGLGRAHMGRRDFAKAIAAYTRCRELYLHAAGQQVTNDMDAKRRIEDRMLQYQTALSQARTTGSGAGTQTQQLYIRELQLRLTELRQARDRSLNVSLDTKVPFYVSMALGAAYFRSNDFASAEREYKAALDANAGSGETHNNLAVLYLMTGRAAQAADEIKLAEQTGFKANPALKEDIQKHMKRGG